MNPWKQHTIDLSKWRRHFHAQLGGENFGLDLFFSRTRLQFHAVASVGGRGGWRCERDKTDNYVKKKWRRLRSAADDECQLKRQSQQRYQWRRQSVAISGRCGSVALYDGPAPWPLRWGGAVERPPLPGWTVGRCGGVALWLNFNEICGEIFINWNWFWFELIHFFLTILIII